MAGICKYCGAKTWGRYRICPDCRYAIKRGRLEERLKVIFKERIIIVIGAFLLIIIFIFFNSSEIFPNRGELVDSREGENISSQEEILIDSCISQFSNAGIFNLKKTNYQNNFSSASDWVRNNYEDLALTQEQKEHNINYIIENQLPKQDYPIVITYGSEKEGGVISQGFYYCNKNGLI